MNNLHQVVSRFQIVSTSAGLPATILPSPSVSHNNHHTILVASLTATSITLVFIILAIIFIRHRRRRRHHQNAHSPAFTIQKKHSRAQLLPDEDTNESHHDHTSELASPTASSGIGSFGYNVFGKIIGGRDTRRDRGAGPYQDITSYAPPPSMTPWDSPRDPRSIMEALHHPSRVHLSEAKRYMSQYLSRQARTEQGHGDVGVDMGVDDREVGVMKVGSPSGVRAWSTLD